MQKNKLLAKQQVALVKVSGGITELEGWVTEEQAAEIRRNVWANPSFNRSTISRWRKSGHIRSIHLYGILWLVNKADVETVPNKPLGSPLLIGDR